MNEERLLDEIDPYYQALKGLNSIEAFGKTSNEAHGLLQDLRDAYRKGIADAVVRLHQHYYKKNKMPMHLFEIMQEVYGEGGWFI
ncbi:hypothetical protein LCGC14_1821370 [marine sediment metagenome]|uniref:Uncharacterized protein n=1 Tax=marine sediment metagenome TaxID=412755 RepID=A0A0F9H6W8_9ZZZZ